MHLTPVWHEQVLLCTTNGPVPLGAGCLLCWLFTFVCGSQRPCKPAWGSVHWAKLSSKRSTWLVAKALLTTIFMPSSRVRTVKEYFNDHDKMIIPSVNLLAEGLEAYAVNVHLIDLSDSASLTRMWHCSLGFCLLYKYMFAWYLSACFVPF